MKFLFFSSLFLVSLFSCNSKMNSTQNNTTRLHDIWALTEISENGLPLEVDLDSQRRPVMELHIDEMKIYGNDGCNDIIGEIKLLDTAAISFGSIAGTKMLCPNMILPNTYNKAIQKVRSYKLDGLVLIFYDEQSKETLRFKKVD